MSEPIHVAQILNQMDSGGIEAVVMNYYRHINKDKVQFDFYFNQESSFPQRDELERYGAKVYFLPSYVNVINYHKKLYWAFKDKKYKIVHAHLNTMSVFPLFAAWRAGVPVRICHNHSTAHQGEGKRTVLKYILRPFNKIFATDYFACGELAGRWMYGDKCFDDGEVTVMQNAIDTKRFQYDDAKRKQIRKEFDISEEAFVIGHVGRFAYQKNHRFMISVFEKLLQQQENAYMLLVGEGELQDEIQCQVEKLGLRERVIFTGARQDVNDMYSAMDVFFLPSFYEGVAVVAWEAQANGLPIVSSNNVSEEIVCADNISRLNLEEGEDLWIEKLIGARRGKDATVPDIAEVVGKVQNFYLTKG